MGLVFWTAEARIDRHVQYYLCIYLGHQVLQLQHFLNSRYIPYLKVTLFLGWVKKLIES